MRFISGLLAQIEDYPINLTDIFQYHLQKIIKKIAEDSESSCIGIENVFLNSYHELKATLRQAKQTDARIEVGKKID